MNNAELRASTDGGIRESSIPASAADCIQFLCESLFNSLGLDREELVLKTLVGEVDQTM